MQNSILFSDKFEAEDVHRVMTDDNYLGRFFKHVYDEPGDQIELSTNMIVNSLQWRKSMDVKGIHIFVSRSYYNRI